MNSNRKSDVEEGMNSNRASDVGESMNPNKTSDMGLSMNSNKIVCLDHGMENEKEHTPKRPVVERILERQAFSTPRRRTNTQKRRKGESNLINQPKILQLLTPRNKAAPNQQ